MMREREREKENEREKEREKERKRERREEKKRENESVFMIDCSYYLPIITAKLKFFFSFEIRKGEIDNHPFK